MKNEDKFLKSFGAKLRALRKEKGLTQDDIALDIGMDRSFISEIENGHKNPSVYTVNRILNYLGKNWKDLG